MNRAAKVKYVTPPPKDNSNSPFIFRFSEDEQVEAERRGRALDDVRAWLDRFVRTVSDSDLDLLALWITHTHLINECYTTPRLLIDSPVPGSGKTTALEHIFHLALRPVQMAVVSSPAMLARLLESEMRTLLIDEADRSLRPDAPSTPDVLAILNSGYKKGATRPVLVPDKESGWKTKEMPTFAPVAMAGNNPQLPDDTRSRTVRILLLPDLDGRVEESDWELIEDDAKHLADRLAAWAGTVREQVAGNRPTMPQGVTGRFREKWQPLARVAAAAGGTWPARVDAMALADVEQVAADREDGMLTTRPHIVLLQHLAELWPKDEEFIPTADIVDLLVRSYPESWSSVSPYGKDLTVQRFGRMLAMNYKVNSKFRTTSHSGPRGYRLRDLADVMGRMGLLSLTEPSQPSEPTQPSQPEGTDRTSRTVGTVPRKTLSQTDPNLCEVCGEPLAQALIKAGDHVHIGCAA